MLEGKRSGREVDDLEAKAEAGIRRKEGKEDGAQKLRGRNR